MQPKPFQRLTVPTKLLKQFGFRCAVCHRAEAAVLMGIGKRQPIASRTGELARTISPVRRRLLNTVPGGTLSPIFAAICKLPRGVNLLPRQSPIPNFEVETG